MTEFTKEQKERYDAEGLKAVDLLIDGEITQSQFEYHDAALRRWIELGCIGEPPTPGEMGEAVSVLAKMMSDPVMCRGCGAHESHHMSGLKCTCGSYLY